MSSNASSIRGVNHGKGTRAASRPVQASSGLDDVVYSQVGHSGDEEVEVPLVALNSDSKRKGKGKATTVSDSEDEEEEDDDEDGISINDELHPSNFDTEKEQAPRRSRRPCDAHEDDRDDDALAMLDLLVHDDKDDPTLPNLTFRVLLLGSILCMIGAAISQLFFFKSNAPSFSGFLIILLSYPAGHWLSRVLPTTQHVVHVPIINRPFAFTLNPGPFNHKEHILISILAGSGSGAAYGADIIAVQDLYYHQNIGPIGGILLLLSTQMLGFGLSGLVYNLLVKPRKMVWPSVLVPLSLFNTLHGDKETDKLTQLRLRFFKLVFLCIFAWQFLPSVVAPVLTSFAVVCIMSPDSVKVGKTSIPRVLGSAYSGYGFLNFSFDWSVIGSTGGLYTPWFASLNRFIGFFGMMWLIAPLLYFSNWWNARSFDSPIGPGLYNRFFEKFDITTVIDPETLSLDFDKWETSKPLLLTPYFALTYGTSFAILTATIVTVILYHKDDILSALPFDTPYTPAHARSGRADRDIHVQKSEATYEPVPGSWYAYIGCTMVAAAIIVVTCYPMQLPVWALLLSLVVALIFLPACGIIAATSGTVIGLNVITEFIAGFLLPGKPIANVTFKCFGYMVMSQALALVMDLKLGLYAKIQPKAMFICQSWGTALGATVNYIYVRSVIDSKRPYLDGTLVDPTGQWTGRSPQIFYSASVIWGLVGPARFFDGNYKYLYLGFPLGALLPLIPFYLSKRYPEKRWLKKTSIPILLDGALSAPQIPTNTMVFGLLSAWLSQRIALRRYPAWYEKYNFVLSAALDAGTSIQALVVYIFGIGYFPEWWGNSSLDSEHCLASSQK